ncbi:hypothetical protein BD626DRAFT_257515 [Schizophyllum amplum]|uniref:Uncharacterized protein n=1 Tax=Schizophyllum amplum TaxID=97359 RepID=A0A550BUR3_9AGAR|nr:hypothetical protein BD626DRAFT_257515 [Auriculariopsis ampla]
MMRWGHDLSPPLPSLLMLRHDSCSVTTHVQRPAFRHVLCKFRHAHHGRALISVRLRVMISRSPIFVIPSPPPAYPARRLLLCVSPPTLSSSSSAPETSSLDRHRLRVNCHQCCAFCRLRAPALSAIFAPLRFLASSRLRQSNIVPRAFFNLTVPRTSFNLSLFPARPSIIDTPATPASPARRTAIKSCCASEISCASEPPRAQASLRARTSVRVSEFLRVECFCLVPRRAIMTLRIEPRPRPWGNPLTPWDI